MNGIPSWAKNLGLGIAAMVAAVGMFVTRPEFNALDARLVAIQETMNQVLLAVGGKDAKDIVAQDLPCSSEADSEKLRATLDRFWEEAKAIAHSETKQPRPTFCFGEYVVVVPNEKGGYDRLIGLYSGKLNRAFVALLHSELQSLGRCAVLHEMLHAIVGNDEKKVLALLPDCPGK